MSDDARSRRAAYYHDDDDIAVRRAAVATIVRAEMTCADDHWNDEMTTRPDAGWLPYYHDDDDAVMFCGRPHPKHIEAWISAYIEAEDEVIELRFGGHARARAILDLSYEMAFTCDDCGLWSFVGHESTTDAFSEEERSGSLFASRSCDKDAVNKLFGKPFDPDSAWDREEIAVEPGVPGSDLRMKRSSREKYNKMRRERAAAEREANRAEPTS